MKIQINHQNYDIPEDLAQSLRLHRYRDVRKKPNVISIRITTDEKQLLAAAYERTSCLFSFSVWLHDFIFKALSEQPTYFQHRNRRNKRLR